MQSRLIDHPYFKPDNFLVMAHRGGCGLAPENTMAAFENAVSLGADVLELDVRSTSDGTIVVIHDPTVDRTTQGSGNVNDFTLSKLKKLCAGYHWTPDTRVAATSYPFRSVSVDVPTLEEVFQRFPNIRMNIDIKQSEPSIVQPFCRMIRNYGRCDRVLVASFDSGTIREFRNACPEVATAASDIEVRWFCLINRIFPIPIRCSSANAFQVPEYHGNIRIITHRFIHAAHRYHQKVHLWTVNEVDGMSRLIRSGVDGIFTDYPNLLFDLSRARQ